MFGNSVADNILITLEKLRWLIAAANLFVFIHVIGSYQVQFQIQNLLQIICFYSNIESSFPRKLVGTADICDASVWHVGNILGEETEIHTMFQASSYHPHSIRWWVVDALLSLNELWQSFRVVSWLIFLIFHGCSFYNVYRHVDPFLW